MREIVQFFSQVFERIVKNYHLLDNLCACGMNTWEKAGRRITDEPYKGTTNEEEEEEGHRLVVQDNPWRWKRWALVSSLDWARLASVDPFNQEKREREREFSVGSRFTFLMPRWILTPHIFHRFLEEADASSSKKRTMENCVTLCDEWRKGKGRNVSSFCTSSGVCLLLKLIGCWNIEVD